MRVIAGSARHLPLQTIEGMDTRPTQDRIKETLFNMIQQDIPGCCFLDLFSGSGGIGIEALSRGASQCYFVEKAPAACACIEKNLQTTHLSDKGILLRTDVFQAIPRIAGTVKAPFDFIFMDPPYRHEFEREVLGRLAGSPLVDEWTTIIVEASLETDFSYVEEETPFRIRKEKRYKTNKHMFLGLK